MELADKLARWGRKMDACIACGTIADSVSNSRTQRISIPMVRSQLESFTESKKPDARVYSHVCSVFLAVENLHLHRNSINYFTAALFAFVAAASNFKAITSVVWWHHCFGK